MSRTVQGSGRRVRREEEGAGLASLRELLPSLVVWLVVIRAAFRLRMFHLLQFHHPPSLGSMLSIVTLHMDEALQKSINNFLLMQQIQNMPKDSWALLNPLREKMQRISKAPVISQRHNQGILTV